MGQIVWNIEIDENTKLNVKPDGTVKIIRLEDAGKLTELPPEYIVRIAEELNRR